MAEITTRAATAEDAAAVSELVQKAGTLEANTTYAYLLLCTHFANTSAVAERNGSLVGCLLGYRLPERPQTLFAWQIGVHPEARRKGVGRLLLDELLHRPGLTDIEYLETTIAPSNTASRALFEGWAKRHDFAVAAAGAFDCALFGPTGNHEQEDIIRIGPLLEKS